MAMGNNKDALRNAEGAGKTARPFGSSYAWLIADTGHSPSQAPQSMQVAASITYFGLPSLIAETGQVSLHAPHMVQASEIT